MFKSLTKIFSSKVTIPDQALVLDVRSSGEYSSGHIKGAKNIPVDSLQSKVSSIAGYKEKSIVIYCRSGARADMAEILLRQSGFTKVINARSLAKIKNAELVTSSKKEPNDPSVVAA